MLVLLTSIYNFIRHWEDVSFGKRIIFQVNEWKVHCTYIKIFKFWEVGVCFQVLIFTFCVVSHAWTNKLSFSVPVCSMYLHKYVLHFLLICELSMCTHNNCLMCRDNVRNHVWFVILKKIQIELPSEILDWVTCCLLNYRYIHIW